MVITDKSGGVTSTENRLLSAGLYGNTTSSLSKASKKPLESTYLSTDGDLLSKKIPRLTSSLVPSLNLTSAREGQSALTTSLKISPRLDSGNLLQSQKLTGLRPSASAHVLATIKSGTTEGGHALATITKPGITESHLRTLPPLSSARGLPASGRVAVTESQAAVADVVMDSGEIFESQISYETKFSIRDEFLTSVWDNLHSTDVKPTKALQIRAKKSAAKSDQSLRLKLTMIDKLAAALISMPNFSSPNPVGNMWVDALRELASVDPEFILKLSLYAREELNIRTAANFLVAFAAFEEATRPFLQKYFSTTVRLPSDWLEIVELGQYFASKQKKYGEIPKALRLVMVKKFPDFDAYQLSKYNKEKARLKKAKKPAAPTKGKPASNDMDVQSESTSSSDSEMEMVPAAAGTGLQQKRVFTLKRMIRCLHICEPVEHVMCLLGKRYPATDTQFYNSRLPGSFDKTRVGKRMKLPVPETWETQISMNGNKPEVWQSLLDRRKLPYMALLRNIRNLLRAGIDERHHRMANDRLSDREAVIRSRQLPIRFLSAYEVLRQLQNEKEMFEKWTTTSKAAQKTKRPIRKRGKPAIASDPKNKPPSAAIQALAKLMPKAPAASLPSIAKSLRKSKNYTEELINDYKKSLNTALQVATTYNIQPIRGRTLIFCDMGAEHPIGGAKNNSNPMGPCRTAAEAGALLAFMCKSACEQCDFYAYNSKSANLLKVESEKGTILDNVASLKARFSEEQSVGSTEIKNAKNNLVLNELLKMLSNRGLVDTVVWLDGQKENFSQVGNEVDRYLADIAKMYMETVRPSTIFVHVDLSPSGCRKDVQRRVGQQLIDQEAVSPYLIHLAGFSDAILRFIAERTDTSRLRYIDNIDKKYKLAADEKRKVLQQQGKSNNLAVISSIDLFPAARRDLVKGQAVRIFISSTFRDMHGERDLLTRFVIPQLRLNAAKIGLQLYDVDLRWGVTEEESKQSGSLVVCLTEAKRADLFVGILGERYGHRPGNLAVQAAGKIFPEVIGYEDRSVTELEMRVAALDANIHEPRNRTFFYFRDSSDLMNKVPSKFANDFAWEDLESAAMLKRLKSEIRRSGFSVMDGYPAEFGGVVSSESGAEKICRVSHLEDFGERVTVDLWRALTRIASERSKTDLQSESMEFEASLQLHTQRLLYLSATFVGRGQFCTDIVRRLRSAFNTVSTLRSGVLILNGSPGCGKSAVVAQVIQEMTNQHAAVCLYYFADAGPNCGSVRELVAHFGQCLLRLFQMMHCDTAEMESLLSVEERTTPPSFVDLLKGIREVKPGIPLLLVIDGLDEFHADQAGLSFLPESIDLIPENVILMVSCRSGSLAWSSAERMLKSNSTSASRPQPMTVEVPPLAVSDRSAVVKAILARYGKQLGDSAWDNQMSALTQKRQAGLPAYLAMACEELRLFGLYEELSLRVRRLPHTMTQLLGEILSRLEADHGRNLVEHACCLLAVAPSGLLESDLRRLLSIAVTLGMDEISHSEPGFHTFSGVTRNIKLSVFCKLVQSLRGFLSSKGTLALSDSNMREVIEHAYFGIPSVSIPSSGYARPTYSVRAKSAMSSSPGFEKKSAYCRFIATYYCAKFSKLTCQEDSAWSQVDDSVMTDLPYFLIWGRCFPTLARLLTSLHYLAARCASQQSLRRLLADFQSIKLPPRAMSGNIAAELRQLVTENKSVQCIEHFLRRNIGSLSLGSSGVLLWQVAFNDSDSAVRSAAINAFGPAVAKFGDLGMIIRVQGENEDQVETKPMLMTKTQQSILCVDICKDFIAFGCEDTMVNVYHRNGQLFRTLVGHAGPITALCFAAPAGSSLKLFTASHDRTLSCWDVMAGNRLNVFENHQRPITGCAAAGRLLATSSTDCTVAVYDVVTSRLVVRIYDSCPLNAVALHPSGDGRLAVGCWDTAIRMWSATPKESTIPRRVAVFRGHAAPVTAVTFSPCGMYIASGSLDGEIRLFLAEHGIQVGVLGGKTNFAITCLRYLENSLVSASADWSIRVWSRGLGRQIAAFCHNPRALASNRPKSSTYSTPGDGVSCMATSSDNEFMGIATKSGQLIVIPISDFLKSPPYVPNSVKVDTALSPVLAIAFTSSEPCRLVYSCQNGAVRSVEVVGNNRKRFDLVGARSAVGALAAGNRYTATGSADAMVRVYENHPSMTGKSTEVSPAIVFPAHRATVSCLFIDDTYLLSGDMDGTVFVWSLSKRRSLATIVRAHGDSVSAIALTKDHIVTCGSDTIKAWTLTGEPVRQVGSHSSLITTLTCADGCVITGDCAGVIKVHSWRGIEVTSIKTSAASIVGLNVNVELNKDAELKEKSENDAEMKPVGNWADEAERDELEREHANRRLKTPGERARNITVFCANNDGWLRAYRPLEAEVRAVLKAHVGSVTGIAIAPNETQSFNIVSTSLDGACNLWTTKNDDNSVLTDIINNRSSVQDPPSRALFTSDSRYFIVASSSSLSVWHLDKSSNMSLATQHKLTKPINDVCASPTDPTMFYACTDNAVFAYKIDDKQENAPLSETRVPSKELIRLGAKSPLLTDDAIPFGRLIGHPFSPGKVWLVSKFHEIASGTPLGLPLSVEHFVSGQIVYAAIALADGRVHFLIPTENANSPKTSHSFTLLPTKHKGDLPLVAFVPTMPGFAIVVGHRSGAAYLVGPIANQELKFVSLGNLDHSAPVTCVRTNRKYFMTVSANEQLIKLWRPVAAEKSQGPTLRLVGLLPFDTGRIADVCFTTCEHIPIATDLIGDSSDGIVVVDHLAVVHRFAIISN